MADNKRLERIADAWLIHARTWWAADLIYRALDRNPERAWRIILIVLDKAQSGDDLNDLGAGPLEDLLHDYPDQFIERVEELASTNAKFKQALKNVWGRKTIPAPFYDRIQRAAND